MCVCPVPTYLLRCQNESQSRDYQQLFIQAELLCIIFIAYTVYTRHTVWDTDIKNKRDMTHNERHDMCESEAKADAKAKMTDTAECDDIDRQRNR